ncbi:preprotein translocase subunit TatA [Janibacter sp. GS2]|uniref:preprotein translocase subunit TatA n=1 Tax=Janibacter sp. GS2 TaxID=3442646 RepID=UPI003EC05BCD
MPVNGWEFILLIVLAFIILGPARMPEYAAKLARLVVRLRRMANDAKVQLKDQMGPEYEDLDWRQYDPRQYDPRRIVKQALMEPLEDAFSLDDPPSSTADGAAPSEDEAPLAPTGAGGTPWDDEAT